MEFNELNLNKLDKDLTEEERAEWNAIYASYRARSILTGRIVGPELFRDPKCPETVTNELCLAIIGYRVKVVIPQRELWFEHEKRPDYVLNSMLGAEVDYVITHIDRENGWCVGSRKLAMLIRRKQTRRNPPEVGELIPCQIIASGRHAVLMTYGGYDMTVRPRELTYTMMPDLRERFHTNEIHMAVVKTFDVSNDKVSVSVRDAQPHPFDGADVRHPVDCRRAATIGGKYSGLIFCRLEENLDCLCTYSESQYDEDFDIGDQVIVVITRYNYEKKQIYGKIIAKW